MPRGRTVTGMAPAQAGAQHGLDPLHWPWFTVGLVQRGYFDEDIQKILGGKVLRVVRGVWTHRQP